jgi:HEAT repeat protein
MNTMLFCSALVYFHVAGQDVELLGKRLSSKARAERLEAAEVAYRLARDKPDEAAKITLALLDALKDDDEEIRCLAASSLHRLGKRLRVNAKRAVPALIAALNDKSASTSYQAADALKDIGGAAVPALTRALADDKVAPLEMVADVLGRIGDNAQDAVPALVKLLKGTKPGDETRQHFLSEAIVLIDPDNEDGAQGLIAVFKGPTKSRHQGAAELIARTKHGQLVVPFLLNSLEPRKDDKGEDAFLRVARSIYALWEVGNRAGYKEPILQDSLKDLPAESVSSFGAVIASIAYRSAPGNKAAKGTMQRLEPLYLKMLDTTDSWDLLVAIDAAGRLRSKAAVGRLKDIARTAESPRVRREAERALKAIEMKQ